MTDATWPLFKIKADGHAEAARQDQWSLPKPPPWRDFAKKATAEPKPPPFIFEEEEARLINAALFLRRPLLVEGRPGYGKSSIAKAVAHQLGLGEVLYWGINTRSTLQDGLYRYDAIARLQDASLPGQEERVRDIGRYLELGPLGTALAPSEKPRVLLIDEIDKSDIDFPNDLLNVFENGSFAIPELIRLSEDQQEAPVRDAFKVRCQGSDQRVSVQQGKVQCTNFPFVVMTSNGERSFPAPFLRRCIRLKMKRPSIDKLRDIVKAHLGQCDEKLLERFDKKRGEGELATDQLLNAMHLCLSGALKDKDALEQALFQPLEES